jgi:hypothetical protein
MKKVLSAFALCGVLTLSSAPAEDKTSDQEGSLQFYGAHITDKTVEVTVSQYYSTSVKVLGNMYLSAEQWALVENALKSEFVVRDGQPTPIIIISNANVASTPQTLTFYGAHITANTKNDNTVQVTAFDTAYDQTPVRGNVTFSLDQWKAIEELLKGAGFQVLNGQPTPIIIISS